jgi:hypothetical protein
MARSKISKIETLPFPQSKLNELYSPLDIGRVGKFGLQNEHDVLAFIRSPAGKGIATEIAKEGARLSTLQAHHRQTVLTRLMLGHQLRALMLLWLMEDKAEAAEYRKAILEYQQKLPAKTDKPSWDAKTIPYMEQVEALSKILSQYEQVIKKAEAEELKVEEDIIDLESSLDVLVELESMIEANYEAFLNHMDNFEQALPESLSLDYLESEIQALKQGLTEGLDSIRNLLDGDIHQNIVPERQEQMRLHMQLAALERMKEVADGVKKYVGSEGEAVSAYRDAAFILEKEDTLVKHEGKYYLLKPGQSWDSVQKDSAAKEQANQYFEQHKMQYAPAKQVIEHHHGLERAAHQETLAEIQAQLADKRVEKSQKQHQLTLMVAARSSAEVTLNQIRAQIKLAPPLPSVSTKPSPRPTAAVQEDFGGDYYLKAMQTLARGNKLTPINIFALTRAAPESAAARRYTLLFLKDALRDMPRNTPIPFETMRALIQNRPRMGVSPYASPASSAIVPQPAPKAKQVADEDAAPAFNPTPFSKSPFK